jgi:hypothetical protein
MLPSTSREHRLRVLENQEKIAANLAQARQHQGDGQVQMPLIVEVRGSVTRKQRARRNRAAPKASQSDLGEF